MDNYNIKLALKFSYMTGMDPNQYGSWIQTVLFIIATSSCGITLAINIAAIIVPENLQVADFIVALQSIFVPIHTTLKLLWFFKQRENIKDLVNGMKKFWNPIDIEDEEEKKQILKYLWYLEIIYKMFSFSCCPSALVFVLRPVVIQQKILPCSNYVPEYFNFYALYVIETYSFFCAYFAIVPFDGFFGSITMLTVIQWRMLNKRLAKLLDTKINNADDISQLRQKTKECIDYHVFLLNFVKKINNTISMGLLVYVGLVVMVNCVGFLIFSLSIPKPDFIKGMVYLYCINFEYIMFYVIPGQLLTAEAEKTEMTFFTSKWYYNSKFLKPIITMVSYINTKPVNLHAYGMVIICYSSGLQAYKAMTSYYMFLRTINNKGST